MGANDVHGANLHNDTALPVQPYFRSSRQKVPRGCSETGH
jgi:hypothetical protein